MGLIDLAIVGAGRVPEFPVPTAPVIDVGGDGGEFGDIPPAPVAEAHGSDNGHADASWAQGEHVKVPTLGEILTEATKERRVAPRQVAEWVGRYRLEHDPEGRWRYCRFVDISTSGAALNLSDTTPEETQDCRIVVEVTLRADVKHIQVVDAGTSRVGVQFVDLSAGEIAHLDELRAVQAIDEVFDIGAVEVDPAGNGMSPGQDLDGAAPWEGYRAPRIGAIRRPKPS
jgi:hypothetical protein